MTKWLGAVILLLAFLLVWLLFPKSKTDPATHGANSLEQQDTAVASALALASPRVNSVINSNFASAPQPQAIYYEMPPNSPVAPADKPQPLEYTNLPPEIVLDAVRHSVHDYGAMFGGNPEGLNVEITSQLGGRNPKQANFIRSDSGMRINEKGELVDPWGTPYFFHQLSGEEMEIRSAGPDRKMWTADDLITE